MKKTFILLISTLSLSLHAQTSFEYVYDPAGNRIQRNVLTVGGMAQQEGVEQMNPLEEHLQLDNETELTLSLYPNPTDANFSIQVEYTESNSRSENQVLRYQLYNMQGKLIESKESSGYHTSMSLQNEAAGIYFLHILSNDNRLLKEVKIVRK